MARKLKTYQTSLGFFDLAIAAPSMKAALEAWGADSNLFHQGAAKESEDPDVVAATMAAPGVVLKRPVGSSGPFEENAELSDPSRPREQREEGGSYNGERKTAKASEASYRPGGRPQGRNGLREGAKAPRARTCEGGRRPSEGARATKARRRQGAKRYGRSSSEARRNGRGNSSRTPSH